MCHGLDCCRKLCEEGGEGEGVCVCVYDCVGVGG